MKRKDKIRLIVTSPKSYIYSKKYKKPTVMNDFETIEYILKSGCSIARFGDGELDLMIGVDLYFQDATPEIQRKLREVAQEKRGELLLCVPNIFEGKRKLREQFSDSSYNFWRHHLWVTKGYWYKIFGQDKVYGDTNISRFYIEKKDKKDRSEYVKNLKLLFKDKALLFVEGENTKLGIGNDLFGDMAADDCKVRRILCPAKNAFNVYEKILAVIKENAKKDELIVCALGPTATVLCRDLCVEGYQALDLGHIDSEYVLFQKEATQQPEEDALNYKSKMVDSCDEQEMINYERQIICRITQE